MSLFDNYEEITKTKLKPFIGLMLDAYEYAINKVKEKHSEDLGDFEIKTFCDLVHDLTVQKIRLLFSGISNFSFRERDYFKLIYEDNDILISIRFNKVDNNLHTGKTLTGSAIKYDNHEEEDSLGIKNKMYIPVYCVFSGHPPLYKIISYYIICPSGSFSNNWNWYLNDDYEQYKLSGDNNIIPIPPASSEEGENSEENII
jgi:hypothetical protein